MASRIFSAARPQLSSNFATHSSAPPTRAASKQPHNRSQQDETDLPSFSFKDLGASPTVKAVVYTALGIYGTAETYFYGRWAYEKFYTKEAAPEEGSDSS